MPRPAPSPEEEDILASLRRLMTADADSAGHPGDGPSSDPGAAGATLTEAGTGDIGPAGERLLLTDALRVRAAEGQDAGTGQAPAEEPGNAGVDTEPFDDDAPEPDTSEMVAAVTRRLHLGGVDDDATDEDEDAPAEQAGAAQEDPEAATPGDDTEGGHEQDSPETREAEKMAQATARAEDPQESDREPEDILRKQDDESRILDEDTLREIVSQAVREELMGDLGQRITRNVKKLVRREIQRSLAGRAFEE